MTIVTADDIRRYGHRSLADVLRGAVGFYTTYDRAYTYVGVRGFARPGDRNSRVLLLVDGHRMNDALYDMAPLGTDFPMNISLIARVEIIGSSLYGTNAFFAVINVVTKTGGEERGLRVEIGSGSQAALGGLASFGRLFQNGSEMLVAFEGYRSAGMTGIYYPQFDVRGGADGVARDMDNQVLHSVVGSVAVGRVKVTTGHRRRDKGVPTASFDTVFGDNRNRILDDRTYVDVSYEGHFGRGWKGVAHLGYDRYNRRSSEPIVVDDEHETVVSSERGTFAGFTGELIANRRIGPRHQISAEAEVRSHFRMDQFSNRATGAVDDRRQGSTLGIYLQDEFTIIPKVLLNAGVRVDHTGEFGLAAMPRAAVIYLPTAGTALKALYGRAFRAPNMYEQYYYPTTQENDVRLESETVTTTEIVWEQYLRKHVRLSLSAFRYDIYGLITQRSDANRLNDLYFVNYDCVHTDGVEAEVEGRWKGFVGRANYSWINATDRLSGERLSNSPRQLANVNLIAPIHHAGIYVALQSRYVGPRLTLRGTAAESVVTQDVSVTVDRLAALDLAVGIQNLFNRRYSDPGSQEHRQDRIPQDGRSIFVRATIRF